MNYYNGGNYDIIVIGAGHAGCEAALASSRMGLKTLLLTINLDMVAFMPCNPSLGGPAKGIVVREIDALGGEMAKNIDKTYIQMRMLNTGKGPAVRALRAQADKNEYSKEMKKTIEKQKNLVLKQGIVEELIVDNQTCKGVITSTGAMYNSKGVIVTAGTSLRGEIVIGDLKYSSGPNNSKASIKLADNFKKLGFEINRFKTGTPPRIKSSTISYNEIEIQPGDDFPNHFSFSTPDISYKKDQTPCWLTHTNFKTHEIIQENLYRSPMFTGIVEGVGARYCPSIEDKIVRFADKLSHQLFIEPEGVETEEMYVQGLSTSLPEDVQIKMLHSIKGLEKAEILRTGYAIEYDIILPHQLRPTLETKRIQNLYIAGQTNGTSGYEEAAGQGIISGINASLKIQGKKPLILQRSDAYIGVMIDDLVTKGTTEPYRLLTSRAEHRLILRSDNADLRLTDIGFRCGLVSKKEYQTYLKKKTNIEIEVKRLDETRIKPFKNLQDSILAKEFLRRPEIRYQDLAKITPSIKTLTSKEIEQVEIQVKYEGYIKKSLEKINKLKKMESKLIPKNINYDLIKGLATEGKEQLKKIEPETIGQASRISGVNPVDISILTMYIYSKKNKKKTRN